MWFRTTIRKWIENEIAHFIENNPRGGFDVQYYEGRVKERGFIFQTGSLEKNK